MGKLPLAWLFKTHKHDWGVWRWQVEYTSDRPRGFITGRWVRYCKHCSALQYDPERTDKYFEKRRIQYLKRHYAPQPKPVKEKT